MAEDVGERWGGRAAESADRRQGVCVERGSGVWQSK